MLRACNSWNTLAVCTLMMNNGGNHFCQGKSLNISFSSLPLSLSLVTVQGLTMNAIQNNLRVLQKKLAIAKDQLRSHQQGRLDIQIPSRWSKE